MNNLDDLDAALQRLANEPTPPELDGLERRVLARIHATPPRAPRFRLEMLTTGLALAMGVAAASLPAGAATSAVPLYPLGAPSPLAPSSLLNDAP